METYAKDGFSIEGMVMFDREEICIRYKPLMERSIRRYLRAYGKQHEPHFRSGAMYGIALAIRTFESGSTFPIEKLVANGIHCGLKNALDSLPKPLSGGDNFYAPYEEIETQEYPFEKLIAKLPKNWRDYLTLYYVDGLTTPKIAKIYGCTAGNIHAAITRAKRHLKRSKTAQVAYYGEVL